MPARNRVIVLLSAKAGLRAGEIASLTWDMVMTASGQIGDVIELRDRAAKKGAGRLIPMHPAATLRRQSPHLIEVIERCQRSRIGIAHGGTNLTRALLIKIGSGSCYQLSQIL
jgi:integrase